MTPAQFRRIGEALLGPSWQSVLARELRLNGRTVRRYVAGDAAIPAEVARAMIARLYEQAERLRALARQFKLED